MPFDILTTLRVVEGYALASGYFGRVQIGEPKSPPAEGGLTAAIYMDSARVTGLTLTTTIEEHVVNLRIYEQMMSDPASQVETDLDETLAYVLEDLAGDFSLGGNIRAINIAQEPASMGYVDLSGVLFRVADLVLPFIVDDSSLLFAGWATESGFDEGFE